MAVQFNGTDEYLTLADNAALTFPASDWTLAGWIYMGKTFDGTHAQYIATWGVLTAYPSFYLALGGSNAILTRIHDGIGHSKYVNVPTWTIDTWQHVILQRYNNGATDKLYLYLDGSFAWDTDISAFGATDVAGDWCFGNSVDLSPDRWWQGGIAEWGFWNRFLDSDERAALVAGVPASLLPAGLAWSLPLLAGTRSEFAGLAVTDNSGGLVEHPPKVFQPGRAKVIAAARGVRPRSVFHSPVFHSPVVRAV